MIITVLYYIFVAVAVIQIIYYLCFLSFVFAKNKKNKTEEIPVSVIVCAKSEEKNLQELVPLLLKQNHSNFQLILINDASSDNTQDVIESFEAKDKRIKTVNVKNNESFWGNKKYAVTLGIKTAKHNHLLFTDADCRPLSENWIQSMSSNFSEKKSIIIGYGKYETKSSLANLIVRYETLITAIQYFSYAKLGSPYMAVGRNLAYHKNDFFKVNGFIKHIQVKSGDDDLFIQDAANKANTTIEFHPDSHTVSKASNSISELLRQKRRHISTAKYYKTQHKILLGLFYISKFSFWILAAILLSTFNFVFVLIPLLSYLFISFMIVGFSAKKLNEKGLIFFLPFLEIFLVLFQFVIFISNKISKPKHWK